MTIKEMEANVLLGAIAEARLIATALERERCAQVCDRLVDRERDYVDSLRSIAAVDRLEEAAVKIRKGT